MKTLLNRIIIPLLFCCITATQLKAQTHTVSGTLIDSHNGESLQSAAITNADGSLAAVSNNYGYFSLTLSAQKNTILITHVGLVAQRKPIDLSKGDLNLGRIKMLPLSEDLSTVIIKL